MAAVTARSWSYQPYRGNTPSGFGYATCAVCSALVRPPDTTVPRCSVCAAPPTTMTQMAAHSTGRHRLDGSRPVGNSSTTRISVAKMRLLAAWPSAATARTAGSDPGAAARPRSPYCSRNMFAASQNPVRPSSQPMALRGTRAASSPPMPA